MPLNTRTTTAAVHRTTIASTGVPKKDGGRSLLLEAFDLIHSERQVGSLTINFGLGGSISSIVFEERETIPQKSIEFPDDSDTLAAKDISTRFPNLTGNSGNGVR